MSSKGNLAPELINVLRQQNTLTKQLIQELQIFNQAIVPRLKQIESVQEMKRIRKNEQEQSHNEIEEALKLGKL